MAGFQLIVFLFLPADYGNFTVSTRVASLIVSSLKENNTFIVEAICMFYSTEFAASRATSVDSRYFETTGRITVRIADSGNTCLSCGVYKLCVPLLFSNKTYIFNCLLLFSQSAMCRKRRAVDTHVYGVCNHHGNESGRRLQARLPSSASLVMAVLECHKS